MKYFACLIVLLVLHSCKINYSFTGADIPAEAKTFSVQYFPNRAPLGNPDLSPQITEALRDILLSQSNLDLTTQDGDLQYEGSITGYEVSAIAIQGDESAAQNRLTIRLNVKYINTLDRDKDFEREFARYEDYDSSIDLSSIEDELVRTIVEQLVQDIFNQSLGAW